MIRDEDLNSLDKLNIRIKLHHTRLYNLLETQERAEILRHVVALVRFVAAGKANVGFFRYGDSPIHRTKTDGRPVEKETVTRPPQEEMNENEQRLWRETKGAEYAM
jgi:hypothetical protein